MLKFPTKEEREKNRDQSLIMSGRGMEDISRGRQKILSSEREATKNRKSDKGGHEDYKANL